MSASLPLSVLQICTKVAVKWRQFVLQARLSRRGDTHWRRRRLVKTVAALLRRVAARKADMQRDAQMQARMNYLRQRLWFAAWRRAWRERDRLHRREAMASSFYSIRLRNMYFAKLSLYCQLRRRKRGMKNQAVSHFRRRLVSACLRSWAQGMRVCVNSRNNLEKAQRHYHQHLQRSTWTAWKNFCSLEDVEKESIAFALDYAREHVQKHYFRRWKRFTARSDHRRGQVERGLSALDAFRCRRAWHLWETQLAWLGRVQQQFDVLVKYRVLRGAHLAFHAWQRYSNDRRLEILRYMSAMKSHRRYLLYHAFSCWWRWKADATRARYVLRRLGDNVKRAKQRRKQKYIALKAFKRASLLRGIDALRIHAKKSKELDLYHRRAIVANRERCKRVALRQWVVRHRERQTVIQRLQAMDARYNFNLKRRVFNHALHLLQGAVRDTILARRARNWRVRRVVRHWLTFARKRILHAAQDEQARHHARLGLLAGALGVWRGVCSRVLDARRSMAAQRAAQEEYAERRSRLALLGEAFGHWRARRLQTLHVRDQLALALSHSRGTVMRRVFRRLDAVVYRWKQQRVRAMERLSPLEAQIQLRRTHPFFLKWRVATYYASQAAARGEVADAHWKKQQQARVVQQWRQRAAVLRKRRQLLQYAGELHQLKVSQMVLGAWRTAYGVRAIELHKDFAALMHWKRAVCRRAWSAWMECYREVMWKKTRIQRALERRKHDLIREGVLRWFKFALHKRAVRSQSALARQRAALEQVWERVRRIALHWRRLARRRAQAHVSDSFSTPVRHGGLREPRIVADGTSNSVSELVSPLSLSHHLESPDAALRSSNIPDNLSVAERCSSEAIYRLLDEAVKMPILERPHVPLDILISSSHGGGAHADLLLGAARNLREDGKIGERRSDSPVTPPAVKKAIEEHLAALTHTQSESVAAAATTAATSVARGLSQQGVAEVVNHFFSAPSDDDDEEEEEVSGHEREVARIEEELLEFQALRNALQQAQRTGDAKHAAILKKEQDARKPHLQRLQQRLVELSNRLK